MLKNKQPRTLSPLIQIYSPAQIGDNMTVRIFIKRTVPEGKARDLIPLFKKIRQLAVHQEGYISGETLRNYNNSEEFLIISSWQSVSDWESWLKSKERQKIQDEIDRLLGGKTIYDVFHYGFTE